MIKRKLKKCKSCGADRHIFSKGVCKFCWAKSYNPPQKKEVKSSNKTQFSITQFFDYHIKNCKQCEECNSKIYNADIRNIAHILPKRIFTSVKTNHWNFIHLCWQCHSDFDSSWDKAKKMKCWGIAMERFNKIKHLVTENNKILDYFTE